MSLLEKNWSAVSQALSVTGDKTGIVTVASTAGFYSGQLVQVYGNSITASNVKVLEVLSGTQLRVGPVTQQFQGSGTDLSNYTVTASSMISARVQEKNYQSNDEIINAVYEAQPATALRVFPTGPDASYQFLKANNSSVTAGNSSVTQAWLVGTLNATAKEMIVFSSMNQPIAFSLNGVQVAELAQGEKLELYLAGNGSSINSNVTVGAWNISQTSTSGSLRFTIVS